MTPHVALVTQNTDARSDMRPMREAAALAEAGYRVTIVSGTTDQAAVRAFVPAAVALALYDLPRPAEGAIGQVREQSQSLRAARAALRRLERVEPVDIVHGSNPPDTSFLLAGYARRRRPRLVFDQHDVSPVLAAEKFGDRAGMRAVSRALATLERRSFATASLVVFANPSYAERAAREGLLRSPSVVAPNGWRLLEAAIDPSLRAGRDHLCAYVGTTGEQDGILELVDAIALSAHAPRLRVVVVGDGSARQAAMDRAERLGIADVFAWHGWVADRRRIAQVVRSADICLVPEPDTPFNRLASFVKLAEYMSAGRPVLANRLPNAESVAGDSIAYAPDSTPRGFALALDALLADPSSRAVLGERAQVAFDARLAWESTGGPALVAAYERHLGGP